MKKFSRKLFRSLKSQITILFILILVIFFVFGFLFYARSKLITGDIEEKVDKAYDDFLRSTAFTEYVNDCLEVSAKQGLKLVGLQGGRIYEYQVPGTAEYFGPSAGQLYKENVTPFNYSGEIYNLSYGIVRPEFYDDYHRPPPDYPRPNNTDYNPLSLMPKYYTSKFSGVSIKDLYGNAKQGGFCSSWMYCDHENIIPTLCDSSNTSLNYYDVSAAPKSCSGYDDDKGTNDSIQEYLQSYLEQNVRQCVNFANLAKQFGYNITEGEIKSGVLFGEDDILFLLEYPLVISVAGKPPIIKVNEFNLNLDVKFKKLYDVMSVAIKEEISNIFFNMSNITNLMGCHSFNITGLPCYGLGVGISLIKNNCETLPGYCEDNFTDIINVTSFDSLIDGKPYSFYFAVENRVPALDYIHYEINSSYYYYNYLQKNYGTTPESTYNLTNLGNIILNNIELNFSIGEINITPLGIDPDDYDNLRYTYHGWKSNRSAQWGCNILVDQSTTPINYWETSKHYRQGFNGNRLYKDANLTIGNGDAGRHCIVINVTDEEGFTDWQAIYIEVLCENKGVAGECAGGKVCGADYRCPF